MTLGQRIKSLRKQENITQERLAELLSVSPQAVSRWETDVAMPDISLLPALANLFRVSTDYILGMEDYQKNTVYRRSVVPLYSGGQEVLEEFALRKQLF